MSPKHKKSMLKSVKIVAEDIATSRIKSEAARRAAEQAKAPLPSIIQKLSKRIAEADAKFQGDNYTLGTANKAGERAVLGANNAVAGSIKPAPEGDGQTVEITGAGKEPGGQVVIPKTNGWEVIWDDSKNAKTTFGGQKQAIIGNQKAGKFFPFSEDDRVCIPCSGKGYTNVGAGHKCGDCAGSGKRASKAGSVIKCSNCGGSGEVFEKKKCGFCFNTGKTNHRLSQFVKTLMAQGIKPTVRPSRGKVKQFSTVGGEELPNSLMSK